MTLSQVPGPRSTGQAATKGPVLCCVLWCGSGPDSDAFGLYPFPWLVWQSVSFSVFLWLTLGGDQVAQKSPESPQLWTGPS